MQCKLVQFVVLGALLMVAGAGRAQPGPSGGPERNCATCPKAPDSHSPPDVLYEGEGYDSDACDTSCDSWCEVRAATVLMLRNDPNDLRFISQPNGTDAFNYSQFDFDVEPGADIALVHRGDTCWDARYLGLWEVSDQLTVGPFPAGTVFFNTSPPTPAVFPPDTTITANYESELHSLEFNLRGNAGPGMTVAIGARYLNLREQFHATFSAPAVPNLDFDAQVENDLYGIQVGAEKNCCCDRHDRFRLTIFAKAGVYAVDAQHDVSLTVPPAFFAAGSASESDAAFVGEAGISLSCKVSCCCTVFMGYQLLGIDGVAVASDQIAATGDLAATPPVIATGIDLDGAVFYQGGKVGLVFRR